MKIKQFTTVVLTLLLIMGLVLQADAGSSKRRGTNSAEELLIPVGARGTALSGANLATTTGNEAIYWNPAGLGASDKSVDVLFSHQKYLADINVTFAAISARTGIGNLGLSVTSLGFGDIIETTEQSPEGTGAVFSPTFFVLGATYSRAMTDRINAGVTLKLVNESIVSTSAQAIAFDIGVQYKSDIGLQLGVAMKNFGSGLRYSGANLERNVEIPGTEPGAANRWLAVAAQKSELPSVFEIGLAYDLQLDMLKLQPMAIYRNHNFAGDEITAGLEVSYNNMFFLRGGYAKDINATEDVTGSGTYIFGPSFGFGVDYPISQNLHVALDYAYRTADYFSANQLFTLSISY